MVAVDDAALIELRGVGRRVDGFAFEILNTDRSLQGAIKAVESSAPSIDLDTTRETMRTLSGLTIDDPPDIDLAHSRVRATAILQNGSTFPLGVFLFGTDNRSPSSAGEQWAPELFDETFLLAQDLDRTWSLPKGGSVLSMFTALAGEILDPLGIPTDYQVDDVTAASPLTFKVGTPRNGALVALAALLGAMPPFFGNAGYHTLKAAPTFQSPIDHVYDVGTRIVDLTPTITNSSYKAPNRFLVVGDDTAAGAVRGVYDLPASAPNSYAATGRRVTAPVHTVSGVTDPTLANLIAYVDSLKDRTTYGTASFAGAFDPRHGVFDTVQFLGVPYLETGWSVQCTSGGDHRHQLTRMWVP